MNNKSVVTNFLIELQTKLIYFLPNNLDFQLL